MNIRTLAQMMKHDAELLEYNIVNHDSIYYGRYALQDEIKQLRKRLLLLDKAIMSMHEYNIDLEINI